MESPSKFYPPIYGAKKNLFQHFLKTLSIPQFSENFEDKIIVCLILTFMTLEVKVRKSKSQPEFDLTPPMKKKSSFYMN